MNELALFAGAGGGILGGKLLGWRTVCAVEIEPYPRNVLMARQNDGSIEPFPIWDDVRTFDGKPWRGIVDVVSGGFPCQDIANCSSTKTGLAGKRSGLWAEMLRIVGEVEPRFVFVENSAALLVRGIGTVLGDLASLRYHARWGVFSAGDVGALHERERIFIVAHRYSELGPPRPWSEQQHGQATGIGGGYAIHASNRQEDWLALADKLARNDNDLANRLDATHAIGNGQVPAVVRLAWKTLTAA
jgi:DNA (cytosine-5)-methyltransferase 1